MRLLRLQVERFRAVQFLDWHVQGHLACLIGPGDSGKSTIIEALRLVTAPTATFRAADFYGALPDAGLAIAATFTEIPDQLLDERKFGLHLGGVSSSGELLDEPDDIAAPTITVRLEVDQDLQATWRVTSAADLDGKTITANDRRELSIGAIALDLTEDFTWSQRGPLARATAKEALSAILADGTILARDAVAAVDLSALAAVVARTRLLATQLGVGGIAERLDAAIDLGPVLATEVTLVADDLRLASAGTGTRRLLAIAAQLASLPSGAIVAVDEIELGLEPHRIRRVLAGIRHATDAATGTARGQVIFTSHSAQVIETVGVDGLHVVRNDSGEVSVTAPDPDLIDTVRAAPEALLAERVVIGEGKTEVGLLWAYDEEWASRHGGRTLGYEGVAVFDGGGNTKAAKRALGLRRLGYPVLVFADSDQPLTPTADELRAAGVVVVQWDGGMCTEQRVLTDLSWVGLQQAFDVAVAFRGPADEMVSRLVGTPRGGDVLARLAVRRADLGDDLPALLDAGFTEAEVRACFFRAATPKDSARAWFKQYDSAQELAAVMRADPQIPGTPTGAALGLIEAWCYPG